MITKQLAILAWLLIVQAPELAGIAREYWPLHLPFFREAKRLRHQGKR
jgi:hypothetical protein